MDYTYEQGHVDYCHEGYGHRQVQQWRCPPSCRTRSGQSDRCRGEAKCGWEAELATRAMTQTNSEWAVDKLKIHLCGLGLLLRRNGVRFGCEGHQRARKRLCPRTDLDLLGSVVLGVVLKSTHCIGRYQDIYSIYDIYRQSVLTYSAQRLRYITLKDGTRIKEQGSDGFEVRTRRAAEVRTRVHKKSIHGLCGNRTRCLDKIRLQLVRKISAVVSGCVFLPTEHSPPHPPAPIKTPK